MFSIWTIITWIISLIVGRAILQLILIAITSLVSLFICALILRTLVQTFGVKIALYITGGLISVILVVGAIWSWLPTPDPVNPTVYLYVKDTVNGNTFLTPRGIFGRRTRPVTLQYIGAPAIDAPFGVESKEYLHVLLVNKTVAVQNPQTYGNYIGGIIETPEGWIAQAVIIRAGMAWDTDGKWRREERAARRENRGLWSVYSLDEINERREKCISTHSIQLRH